MVYWCVREMPRIDPSVMAELLPFVIGMIVGGAAVGSSVGGIIDFASEDGTVETVHPLKAIFFGAVISLGAFAVLSGIVIVSIVPATFINEYIPGVPMWVATAATAIVILYFMARR